MAALLLRVQRVLSTQAIHEIFRAIALSSVDAPDKLGHDVLFFDDNI